MNNSCPSCMNRKIGGTCAICAAVRPVDPYVRQSERERIELDKSLEVPGGSPANRPNITWTRSFDSSSTMTTLRAFSRNAPYLKQQFIALLGNTSTSVKFICIVMFLGYFLSYSQEAVDVLSVTPGFLMPPVFWLWTAFTFCFLEIHFWEVLVDVVTVGLCGKLIEPLWGQMEMLTFFAIVNFGVAVLSTIFYFVLYMCTFNTDLLFTVHIHGLAGYIAGLTVAVKQIMPDLILIKTPLGKITNRNVPLLVFFASLIFWLVGLLDGTYPTMFLNGILVSWIYLRFYQYHSNKTIGDMADNFTFASFFPNVLQPPIAVVANTIHGFFVRIGVCRKVVRKFDMANPTGITISIPGIDPHDMERRRQIALKALSERLSKTSEHTSKDRQPLLPKSKTVPTSLATQASPAPVAPAVPFSPAKPEQLPTTSAQVTFVPQSSTQTTAQTLISMPSTSKEETL